MLRVGLTGGIGSGKTAVSNLFASHGVPIIDTDVIAHDLVDNNHNVLVEISDTFGTDILTPDGDADRKKLAQIVFNSKKNKQLLERILHPKIETEVKHQLQVLDSRQNPPDYAIVVVPLLIEAGYQGLIDRILVVIADEQVRIQRVQLRDHRSKKEIRAIISQQVDDNKRTSEADDIIENNCDIKKLEDQVKNLHNKYMRLSAELR
jgi:dephospho-CoA kinase